MKQEFNNIGVYPKGNKTQQKVTCPNCFKIGKKQYKDFCLSIK